MPDCATFDFVCKGKSALSNVAGAAASKVTNGFLDELRKSAVDATTSMLKTLGTFWLKIPSPGLDSRPLIGVQGASDTKGLGGLEVLQSNLAWFTIIAAIVGLILCGARMGITARGEHGAEGAKMLVRLIGVAGAGSAVIAVLVKAGDDFSPWLIEQATGQPFDESAPSLVSNAAMLSMTAMLTIILAIVAIFGSLAQVVFMILRGGLLLMLVAVWPLAASMSTTEQGMQWYKKINAYIIAFVLLKPVSAIIYSAGFLLLKGSPGTTGDATTNAITSTLSGLAILGLAGLALPALLRFVTPMMASGSGSLSGGAALGAAVAVGAAVVTMGAGEAPEAEPAQGGRPVVPRGLLPRVVLPARAPPPVLPVVAPVGPPARAVVVVVVPLVPAAVVLPPAGAAAVAAVRLAPELVAAGRRVVASRVVPQVRVPPRCPHPRGAPSRRRPRGRGPPRSPRRVAARTGRPQPGPRQMGPRAAPVAVRAVRPPALTVVVPRRVLIRNPRGRPRVAAAPVAVRAVRPPALTVVVPRRVLIRNPRGRPRVAAATVPGPAGLAGPARMRVARCGPGARN
jgi:type IV secretion system protein TrbL